MVMRVQVVDGEFRVVLPPEAVESMKLSDGSSVQVLPAANEKAASRYASLEEGIKAYFDTLPDHEQSYRELAK
jgi:hypothetical protein